MGARCYKCGDKIGRCYDCGDTHHLCPTMVAEAEAAVQRGDADIILVAGIPGVDFPTRHEDGTELTVREAIEYTRRGCPVASEEGRD